MPVPTIEKVLLPPLETYTDMYLMAETYYSRLIKFALTYKQLLKNLIFIEIWQVEKALNIFFKCMLCFNWAYLVTKYENYKNNDLTKYKCFESFALAR